jgi:hypothetical protein
MLVGFGKYFQNLIGSLYSLSQPNLDGFDESSTIGERKWILFFLNYNSPFGSSQLRWRGGDIPA